MIDNEQPQQNAAEQGEPCACADCEQEQTCRQAQEEQQDAAAVLAQKLEALEAEHTALNDKLLRQLAEFDNYRKRTQRERTEAFADATARCVTDFLPVLDNFERALAFDTQTGDGAVAGEFRKGVEMIFNQLQEAFKKQGVEEIDAFGKPFDPALHNAVNQTENPNFGDNTVCEVFQKGYKLGDRVIRHAVVVVANP